MGPRVVALVLVAVALALAPAPAGAQGGPRRPRSVEISVRSVLDPSPGGSEVMELGMYNPLLITAKNLTGSALRGRILIDVASRETPPTRHVVPLDLPPRATRQAQLTLFVPERTTGVDVAFEAGVLRVPAGTFYAGGMFNGVTALVVPPGSGLRSAVHEDPTTPGLDTAVLPLDPLSGDPVLPRDAAGWAPATIVAATVALAERADADELAALLGWVQAGGRLVLYAADEGELRRPLVTSLLGAVEPRTPDGGGVIALNCGASGRAEPIGCSRQAGLGRVYLSVRSLASPVAADVTAELEAIGIDTRERPLFPFGRALRLLYRSTEADLGLVMTLLDPNQSFRVAMPAVALIILVYVVLVGPVSFALVKRLRRPSLALVTTPSLALAALAAIGIAGVADKGVTVRARTIDVVELAEGDGRGASRAFTGIFFGHPATFDLSWPPHGTSRVARTPGGETIRAVEHGGGPPTYRGIAGRFWGTTFLVEEELVDVGGGVRFERRADSITAVTNGTPLRFRGAILVSGDLLSTDQPIVTVLGPIEPGRRVAVPASVIHLSPIPYPGQPLRAADGKEREMARALGLDTDVARRVVYALFRTAHDTGDPLPTAALPMLIAAVEPPPRRPIAGGSTRELDLRVLCVRVEMPVVPEALAPPDEDAAQPGTPPTAAYGIEAGDAGATPEEAP